MAKLVDGVRKGKERMAMKRIMKRLCMLLILVGAFWFAGSRPGENAGICRPASGSDVYSVWCACG